MVQFRGGSPPSVFSLPFTTCNHAPISGHPPLHHQQLFLEREQAHFLTSEEEEDLVKVLGFWFEGRKEREIGSRKLKSLFRTLMKMSPQGGGRGGGGGGGREGIILR